MRMWLNPRLLVFPLLFLLSGCPAAGPSDSVGNETAGGPVSGFSQEATTDEAAAKPLPGGVPAPQVDPIDDFKNPLGWSGKFEPLCENAAEKKTKFLLTGQVFFRDGEDWTLCTRCKDRFIRAVMEDLLEGAEVPEHYYLDDVVKEEGSFSFSLRTKDPHSIRLFSLEEGADALIGFAKSCPDSSCFESNKQIRAFNVEILPNPNLPPCKDLFPKSSAPDSDENQNREPIRKLKVQKEN